MHDSKTAIAEFLDAAAAKKPTPGGGSVTALAGALAASMGEMVVNYSLGKKGLEQHAGELAEAVKKFHASRQMLVELMAEDQAAYEALSGARKMPQSPERERAIAAAADVCISVPQSIAAVAVAVLELANDLVEKVNHYLLSDLAVCTDLAMATVRCALYNAKVNLPQIEDSKKRWDLEAVSGKLLSRALLLIQRVSPAIWRRVAREG